MRPELLLEACGRPKRFFTPFSIEQNLSEADGKKNKKNFCNFEIFFLRRFKILN
jgi:hypothetical protein